MKKAGKLLIGVLSTTALVGTAYAAWSINKGFTDATSDPIKGVVTEILDNSFGKITIKENDTKVVFDAPKEIYNGTEDLDVSYYVKAFPNQSSSVNPYDPYDLSLYENVSDDYLPYLTIETNITDKDGKDIYPYQKESIEKILDLPHKVIDYKEWLSKEAKENEDGYLVDLSFSWDKETFDGLNPQIYFDKQDLTPNEKYQEFETIINTLKNAYFTFTFKVGFYGEYPSGEIIEKGTINYQEVENLDLKFFDGNEEIIDLNKEIKVDKEIRIEPTLKEGYELISLTHNGVDILESKKIKIAKGENIIIAEVKEKVVEPVATKVVATLKNKEIKVNEITSVDVKDDLGNILTDYEFEFLTENYESFVEIKDNTLKGLKEGSVSFKINKVGLTSSEVLTLNILKEEVPPVETKTIKEIIEGTTTNEGVYVENLYAKVVASNFSEVVIYDGTGFMPIFYKTEANKELKINDYVKVSGTSTLYYGWVQFDKVKDKTFKLEKVTDVTEEIITPEATEFTKDDALGYEKLENKGNGKIIKFTAKCTKNEHVNLFIDGAESVQIGFIGLPNDVKDNFLNDKYYEVTGVLNNWHGSNKFIQVDYISHKEVDTGEEPVIPTKVKEVILDKETIKEEESVLVSAKDDAGNELKEIIINPTEDTKELATVEGNKITGVKAGTFKFNVSSAGLEDSEEISLVIEEKGDEPVEPGELTLAGEYNFDYSTFGGATGNVCTSNKDINSVLALNTIQNQNEIVSLSGEGTFGYDSTLGLIKIGASKSSSSGSLTINTTNDIKKIELTAFLWKGDTSKTFKINETDVTLSVEGENADGKSLGTVSCEFSATKAINIALKGNCRIVIQNIKLYK